MVFAMYVRPQRKQIERAAVGKRRRRALQFVSKKKRRDRRIVIEVVSAADVARLEARDEALKAEYDKKFEEVSRRAEGIHGQLYEFMNRMSNLRSK